MLIFLVSLLSAENIKIDFKETRYIDALNEKVTRNGQISFSNESAKIFYESGNREITLINGQVTIKNDKEIVQKNAKEEQGIINMFAIFRAIFESDEERLKMFFKITQKSQNEVSLRAINSSNPIATLTYKINEGNITKLELFSQSGDRITIDVVKKR
jgi:hypothetical protein